MKIEAKVLLMLMLILFSASYGRYEFGPAGSIWTISGTQAYYTGGYLGIGGATDPNSDLDVGGGDKTNIDGEDDLLVADDVEIDGDLYVEGFMYSDGLSYASVDINSAEILDLADTPITLVAAQGADTVIEFVSATLIHDAGTAYVEPSAPDDLVIEYSGGQDVTAAIDSTGFLTVTDDEARLVPFDVTVCPITTDLVALKNTALQLFNTGQDLTTGTGTMIVKVTYRVHTLGL